MKATPKLPVKHHSLKILPAFFEAVLHHKKRFEVRNNDRDFKSGDFVTLNEWDFDEYTGRLIHARINYILSGEMLKPGHCAFGFTLLPDELKRFIT